MIIFISEAPFIEQSKKDLYYDEISEKFNSEIWDLSNLYNRVYSLPNEVSDSIKIKNHKEFISKLKKLPKGSIFITSSTPLGTSLKIFNNIHSYKHKTFYLKKDLINKEMVKYSNYFEESKHVQKIKSITLGKIYNKLKKIIFGPFKYDIVFQISNCTIPNYKQKISGHNIKYEEYKAVIPEIPIINGKYILYLDTDLPYHHDLTHDTELENIDPDIYFKKINLLFEKLEKQYDAKVIISAHPKSKYTNEFNGREIIKFKTPNLVVNSYGIIAHLGTSIATAVLAQKPIIFPYYTEMEVKACKGWLKTSSGYANYLQSPFINLDNDNYSIDFNLNKSLYSKFIDNFIINRKREEASNIEMILEILEKTI